MTKIISIIVALISISTFANKRANEIALDDQEEILISIGQPGTQYHLDDLYLTIHVVEEYSVKYIFVSKRFGEFQNYGAPNLVAGVDLSRKNTYSKIKRKIDKESLVTKNIPKDLKNPHLCFVLKYDIVMPLDDSLGNKCVSFKSLRKDKSNQISFDKARGRVDVKLEFKTTEK